MKQCGSCKETKPYEMFDKNIRSKDGYNRECKSCKRAAYYKRKANNPWRTWIIAKKSECKKKGIPFNLTETYIKQIWTGVCPVFGEEITLGNKGKGSHRSGHLDRLIPELGYVEGNVFWISGRANRIKYDASVEELRRVADWMEGVTTISKESTSQA